MRTEALIVRHAQSVWNAEGRWQGHADPPLSEAGEAQARRASFHLLAPPVDVVVTSDLQRARRTGQLLAGDVPSVQEPLLRELDVGHWSGLTRAEIERRWPDALGRFDRGELARAPGGEDRLLFDQRVAEAASRLAAILAEHRARRALVVAHGGVVRALARHGGVAERHVSQLCGYEAAITPDGLQLGRWVDLLGQGEDLSPAL